MSRQIKLPARTLLLLIALGLGSAQAEKADREKPIQVEADRVSLDDMNKLSIFEGNVVLTQGTLLVKADKVTVRQDADKTQYATAVGRPLSFRQKRDGADDFIEGWAERLEYDGKTDTIRFVTNAAVRRLRGSTVADEIAGNVVSYDSIAEVFSVSGGAAATPANPGGRVRAVLTPREGSAAAAEAAAAAASEPAPPLKLSPALGSGAK